MRKDWINKGVNDAKLFLVKQKDEMQKDDKDKDTETKTENLEC
jgi:hypothetical protein